MQARRRAGGGRDRIDARRGGGRPRPRESADGAALVEVQAPGARGAMALERRGLDVVEIEPATVEMMLHSGRDRAALEASGYEHEVLVEDIGKADRKQRAAEERAEAALAEDPALASALPTGRVL